MTRVVIVVLGVLVIACVTAGAAFAQAPEGVSQTPPMSAARAGHTSSNFTGGLAMICGGTSGGPASKACESYDPVKKAWAPQTQMSSGRAYHAISYLSDLQMYFIVGGLTSADPGSAQVGADMYNFDQQSSTWKLQQAPGMERPHAFFGMNSAIFYNVPQQQQATVLVPAVGPGTDVDVFKMVMTSTGGGGSILWFQGQPIPHARDRHSAVPLLNGKNVSEGKVLVVGGYVAEAEIYDPAADSWTPAGTMNDLRGRQAATVLNDRRVMVCGGEDAAHVPVKSCEIWDPAKPTEWVKTGDLASGRTDFAMVTLVNDKVYAVGGAGADGKPFAGAEALWDPADPTWKAAVPLATSRSQPTATGLATGQVLVCGGKDASGQVLASCELYQPQQLCAPAKPRCVGRVAQVCDDTGMKWMKVADCQVDCKDDVCPGEQCTPGVRRCKTAVVKETVEECAASGDHWVWLETCDQGCEHDTVTAWCTGEPRPDAGYIDAGPGDTGHPDAGCVPDCSGAVCGQGDGCGGICANGACPDDLVCDPVIFICTTPKPDAGHPAADGGGGGGGKDAGTGAGAQPGGNGTDSGGGGCSCAVLEIQ